MLRNRSIICLSLGLISLGLVFLLCACIKDSGNSNITDPKFIDNSWMNKKILCTPPCWYGLIPGKSTKEDVIKEIQNLGFLNLDETKEKSIEIWSNSVNRFIPGDEIQTIYKKPLNMLAVDFRTITDDKLYDIKVFPNFQISFYEVVDEIGIPDGFFYQRNDPEGKGCDVGLVWISRKMILYHYGERTPFFRQDLCEKIIQSSLKMPNELNVDIVHIMEDSQLQSYLSLSSYKNWQGFIDEK